MTALWLARVLDFCVSAEVNGCRLDDLSFERQRSVWSCQIGMRMLRHIRIIAYLA
jgi:hypothetical protein